MQSKCTTFNESSIQNSFPNQMSMPIHTIQPNHPQGHQPGHQGGHQMTLQANHQQSHGQFGPALNKDKYLIQVHHPNHFEPGVTACCSYCFMPMKTKEDIQRHAQAGFKQNYFSLAKSNAFSGNLSTWATENKPTLI